MDKRRPLALARYENVYTGEQINYDPRVAAESLKLRGVPIQSIRLV
jgi:hypothetical protein